MMSFVRFKRLVLESLSEMPVYVEVTRSAKHWLVYLRTADGSVMESTHSAAVPDDESCRAFATELYKYGVEYHANRKEDEE